MDVVGFIVNINSEQPEDLKRFYRDVVGLPPHADPERESTYMAASTEIVIDVHGTRGGMRKGS